MAISALLYNEPIFQCFLELKDSLEERVQVSKVIGRIISALIFVLSVVLAMSILGVGVLFNVHTPLIALNVTFFTCIIFLSLCLAALSRQKSILIQYRDQIETIFGHIRRCDAKFAVLTKKRESLVEDILKENVASAVRSLQKKDHTRALLQQSFLHQNSLMEDWVKTSFFYHPHIKDHVKEKGNSLEHIHCLYPSLETIQRPGKFLLQWRGRPEFDYRQDPCAAMTLRCKREWLFILLGFFSFDEVCDIADLCREVLVSGRSRHCSKRSPSAMFKKGDLFLTYQEKSLCQRRNEQYALCIKKFPKLVAAETAFLFWLQQSFPYLLSSEESLLFSPASYRATFFDVFIPFLHPRVLGLTEEQGLRWLSQFRGIIPSCLALLNQEEVTMDHRCSLSNYSVVEEWGWIDFCDRMIDYCRENLFSRDQFGSTRDLIDYLCHRDFRVVDSEEGHFLKGALNFFYFPSPLWSMGELCRDDNELLVKIEEGLRLLYSSGYLGEYSVEEMRAFAKEILGLSELEEKHDH